jgi:hypothetical protein
MNWQQYTTNNQFFHVTLNQYFADHIEILPYFKYHDASKYTVYCTEYGYTGSWNEYCSSAQLIFEAINNYDTSILKLRLDPLFRAKEFGQLCSIIKEIYVAGALNIPTIRIENGRPAVHPGNHLCYAMLYFGMPITCFITVDNDISRRQLDTDSVIHQQIHKPEQIHEILGTDDIQFWIQKMGNHWVPHVYPSISVNTSWKSYENGDCAWPWQEVEQYNQSDFTYAPSQVVALRDYPNERLLENNRFAFWLTGLQEDQNFRRRT